MQSVETAWRDSLFSADPIFFDGMPEVDQLRYREFVRDNIVRSLKAKIPLTKKFASSDQFNAWVTKWLELCGPKTRIYWKLPIEFALWLVEIAGDNDRAFAELAHFEAMQISCNNAEDSTGPYCERSLTPDTCIELDSSCRLCIYHYPIFLLDEESADLPSASATPNFLLLYRRDEETNWLQLEPQFAQFLAQLADGKTISESLDVIQRLYQRVDTESLMLELAKLNRQKILWPALSCAEQ